MIFSTDWCRFAMGESVIWHHESRGGYGYVSHVPAKVVGIGTKRVKIAAELANGGTKEIWVTIEKLRLPGEKCAVPVCAYSQKQGP